MSDKVENVMSYSEFAEKLFEKLDRLALTTKKYLTAEEAADYFGVSVDTIYLWAKTNKIGCSKPGRGARAKVFFSHEDIDELMEKSRKVDRSLDYILDGMFTQNMKEALR